MGDSLKIIILMKYSFVIAALIANTKAVQLARDVKDVWELRSVNGEADNADVQKSFGDHATASANARPAMRSWVNLESDLEYPEPQMGKVCDGSNGSKMQDCRVSRWHDQNPICSGAAGERPGHNCLDRASNKNAGALAQYPEPQMGKV